ncbi:MAG: Holliday junction resolvase-like protein [Candidatus Pacearchaeota archaeon]
MVEFTTVLLLLVFLIGLVVAYILGSRVGAKNRDKWWEGELPGHRKDAIMKSRAVLGGQFSEQLAPFLPDFKYSPTECRFIGKPIDLMVFNGMDNKDINEVVFVEVKSSGARLSLQEKKLKEAVENKNVRWEEYRIPKELTKRKLDSD